MPPSNSTIQAVGLGEPCPVWQTQIPPFAVLFPSLPSSELGEATEILERQKRLTGGKHQSPAFRAEGQPLRRGKESRLPPTCSQAATGPEAPPSGKRHEKAALVSADDFTSLACF